MSDVLRNPKERFSRDIAQVMKMDNSSSQIRIKQLVVIMMLLIRVEQLAVMAMFCCRSYPREQPCRAMWSVARRRPNPGRQRS